jgi:transcriptional regulator with XRE-family HTH domain
MATEEVFRYASESPPTETKLSTIRYTEGMEPASAGALLRQARKRAGLSQVDLAGRAGVTQSVISAYESGRRQPSIPALARLIDAAGFELTLGLRRSSGHRRRLPVGRQVRRHRRELVAVAANPSASRAGSGGPGRP